MTIGYNANPHPVFDVPALDRPTGNTITAKADGVVLIGEDGVPVLLATAEQLASLLTLAAGATPAGENTIGGVFLTAGYSASGKTPWFLDSAANNNAQVIASAPIKFYGGTFTNTTASVKFVKLYNKASTPTVGTDTPLVVIAIPPNDSVQLSEDVGIVFGAGLGIAIVAGGANSDNTAVALGDVNLTLFCKT